MQSLIPLVLMLVLTWAFLIRPQQQRVRRQQELSASLAAGDRVITAGGMFGTVTGFDEDTVLVQVAPDVEIRLLRMAIARKVDEHEHHELELDEREQDEQEEL
jgi:preprotein translocase subunit YajC